MSVLIATDIAKTFVVGHRRVHALNGVSLEVGEGECLAIIGESGSGKSTFGRVMLGLITPDAGSFRYVPRPAGKGRQPAAGIQAVFQEPYDQLNPRHRVISIVREPLDINRRDLGKSERTELARRALALVRLAPEFHERYPRDLSGGQQQRVGIARALVLEPDMLVLDEPTSSLDVSVRAQILELLRELKATRSISMLYISHDIGSVESIADRVAVLYRGQVMELGDTSDVLNAPAHPYTKALLSARLRPDPRVKPQYLPLRGEIPSQATIPNHCLFAGRCVEEIDVCTRAPVPLAPLGTRRQSRCLRHASPAIPSALSFGQPVTSQVAQA